MGVGFSFDMKELGRYYKKYAEIMEFWEKKSIAVARGNAIAIKGDKRLKARVLTAHFEKTQKGNNEIIRVNAFEVFPYIRDRILASHPSQNFNGFSFCD